MIPVILAAGAAVAEGVAAIGGALLTAEGAALAGSAATAYVAKQAATAVGLGTVAAAAVLGGLTIWQLGKLGCKLLDKDKE